MERPNFSNKCSPFSPEESILIKSVGILSFSSLMMTSFFKLYQNLIKTIYEQKDDVSMGASLGPVLANIIMTECEKVIVDNLVKEGTIKFYVRYVDGTLLLVKRQDI